MKKIFSKLNSRSGATIVLALMFMLICVFVGGSVLVAATVNGGRLADKRETQQAVLNQRSILSVFVKELTDEQGKLDFSYTPASGTDDGNTPASDTEDGALKQAIFASVDSWPEKIHFTVTDPHENEIRCYAVCVNGFTVNICFEDDPQVQLELRARQSGEAIQWYDAAIGKAVTDDAENP